jgi:hypothetical protein
LIQAMSGKHLDRTATQAAIGFARDARPRMNLDPVAVVAFKKMHDDTHIAGASGDTAARVQGRTQLRSTEPSRVAQNRDAVEQRACDDLAGSAALALQLGAEHAYLKQPRGVVNRMRPSEEDRAALAHALLEVLQPVLRLDQFTADPDNRRRYRSA